MLPVFLASDEQYIKYAAVTIASIISNTKSKINFYILDGGISSISKSKLEQMLTKTPHTIEFIEIPISIFEQFPNLEHFSLNMYSRYLIPQLKPELKKALYIDSDMIVCGDILEIFNRKIDNGLGAVPYLDEKYNTKVYKKYKQKLGIDASHLYFNSGLLLIDCDFWRNNNIIDVLIRKTLEMKPKLSMPDQDILNVVFNKKYDILPDCYNFVVDLTPLYMDLKKFIQTSKQCFILHYTGKNGIRPWVKKDVLGENLYWNYAKITPFFHELQLELILNEILNISKTPKETYFVKLFHYIPLIKIKRNKGKVKIYLFGILPILSYSKKG